MLLKPIEYDSEKKSTGRVWLKALFLTVLVVVGMGFISQQPVAKPVIQSNNITPTPLFNVGEAQEQSSKLFEKTVDQTQDKAGSVLGEVTKVVESKASESAQLVVDYAYKNTMLQMIEKLVESLPERQQEQFKQNMCK